MLIRNKHFNDHLQNAFNKYGINNFSFKPEEELNEISLTESVDKELLKLEQTYLDIAKQEKNLCYNKTFIAGKVEMTDKVKTKISKLRIEQLKNKKSHPMFGKKHKECSKLKMSLSHLGKPLSQTAKLKISGKNSVAHREDVKNCKRKWWEDLKKDPVKYKEFCMKRSLKSVKVRMGNKNYDRKENEIVKD
jgi:group I intron endonuclease